MALTLVEAAKLHTGDVIRSAIVRLFAESDDLLGNMPFDDIPGNALRYTRENTLPTVAFRGLNEGYTENTGNLAPLTESLMIVGGDLDVDKFIVDTMGQDQRSVHEAMKVKKIAHTVGNKMVKGDSTSDPKEFDGLQARLSGAQLIENGASPATGDPLRLQDLDEAIDAVDDPTHLYMSKAMRRRFTAAARTSGATTPVAGNIVFQQDQFGRRQEVYNGLPILIADRNQDIFNTLAFDEAATGGGSTSTSIYVLELREGMLQGIQKGMMDVRDLGELESKPVFRTRVEWYIGMVLMQPRAACRLRGITDAAIVA